MNHRQRKPSSSAAWLAAVATAFIGAFSAGWFWRTTDQAIELPPLFQDAPSAQTSKAAKGVSNGKARVIVHVAGAVRKPSVVTLNAGSRVHDAVRAAGGAKPDAVVEAINLAALLEDGQQIRIPTRSELLTTNLAASTFGQNLESADTSSAKVSGRSQSGGRKPVPSAPVNINSAAASELEALPGVGPALAQRIIEYRSRHGRFESVSDLDQVKGFGPKKVESLRRWVRFR